MELVKLFMKEVSSHQNYYMMYLIKKISTDEFTDQFDVISQELPDILQDEYDEDTLDTEYYLDKEISVMILKPW